MKTGFQFPHAASPLLHPTGNQTAYAVLMNHVPDVPVPQPSPPVPPEIPPDIQEPEFPDTPTPPVQDPPPQPQPIIGSVF